MYSLIKHILFQLPPETAHHVTLRALQLTCRLGWIKPVNSKNDKAVKIMGLYFPNSIGLAAGLDKNGQYVDALSTLGFGFIEIGTVTPKPQAGNPKPRLFRLIKEKALINRMGFPSRGMEYVAKQLEKVRYRGILGINIGKNKETPLSSAVDDYVAVFRRLWSFASYVTINISSPNTENLRDLQQENYLHPLLSALKQEQKAVMDAHQKYIPLVVKISPDLTTQELHDIADILIQEKIDGVIATNTTISREGIEPTSLSKEMGGLSGKPLCEKSTAIIRELHTQLQGHIPIIGCGGMMDRESAAEKLKNGASLLQIYTGLIYQGPGLVGELIHKKLF